MRTLSRMDGLRADILTKDLRNKNQESCIRSSRRSLLRSRKSFIFVVVVVVIVVEGRDSSVGIATRYRLDDPGIESRWGEIFHTLTDRPRNPSSGLYKGTWSLSRG